MDGISAQLIDLPSRISGTRSPPIGKTLRRGAQMAILPHVLAHPAFVPGLCFPVSRLRPFWFGSTVAVHECELR